jgi:hypothetical protein
MPASLYRLAGRPHPAEVSTAQPASAQVNSVEAEAIESFEENNAIVLQEIQASEPAPVVQPTPQATWDVGWTKTQLLVVANELGLNVTSTNTKTEILAALESVKTV